MLYFNTPFTMIVEGWKREDASRLEKSCIGFLQKHKRAADKRNQILHWHETQRHSHWSPDMGGSQSHSCTD